MKLLYFDILFSVFCLFYFILFYCLFLCFFVALLNEIIRNCHLLNIYSFHCMFLYFHKYLYVIFALKYSLYKNIKKMVDRWAYELVQCDRMSNGQCQNNWTTITQTQIIENNMLESRYFDAHCFRRLFSMLVFGWEIIIVAFIWKTNFESNQGSTYISNHGQPFNCSYSMTISFHQSTGVLFQ